MLALAVISQQSWAAGARGTAKGLLAPLEAQMMSIASSVERATAIFGDIATLRAENQRLNAENQDLRRRLAELDAAAYDNKELRQALDFQRTFGHRTAVAEVVGSFDGNDAIADFRVLFAEIFGEFRLGAGRANDKDFAGIADGVHHLRKKFLVKSGMTAADRVGLVMNVLGRMVGMQNQSFDICRIEMEHAGFTMINPDNGMIVRLAHRCVLYDALH